MKVKKIETKYVLLIATVAICLQFVVEWLFVKLAVIFEGTEGRLPVTVPYMVVLQLILYGTFVFWIVFFLKKAKSLGIWEAVDCKVTRKTLFVLVIAVVVAFIFVRLESLILGGYEEQFIPQIVEEITGFISGAGFIVGTVFALAQYIYYFLEAATVVLLIVFAQETGELFLPKLKKIPWGGIFAGITWGMMVHARYGLPYMPFFFLYGTIIGCCYLYSGKQFWSGVFMFLAFYSI